MVKNLSEISDDELVRALENPLYMSFDDERRESLIDLNRLSDEDFTRALSDPMLVNLEL
jgi:hypothetical protein